jgi:pilus assembly protein CpaB
VTRRTGWILLSLGLILAIGSGALVYTILQQQSTALEEQRTAAAEPVIETVPLPVAARALEPGRPLTAEDVVIKQFPVDLVPPAPPTWSSACSSARSTPAR